MVVLEPVCQALDGLKIDGGLSQRQLLDVGGSGTGQQCVVDEAGAVVQVNSVP